MQRHLTQGLCALRCGERTLHVAEGRLGASEQGVDAPGLLGREVSAVALEQVGALQALGAGMALLVAGGRERARIGVVAIL
jgi:hypothetical protein